jgi:hypothetical protein
MPIRKQYLPETSHPQWLHTTAHVLLLVTWMPFYWQSRRYSHSDAQFSRKLALLNVVGTVYSLLLQIFIQTTPAGCIFFCMLFLHPSEVPLSK